MTRKNIVADHNGPGGTRGRPAAGDPYERRRAEMVARYVQARGVNDARTLAAMRAVPRHLFVEPALRDHAYEDFAGPIGGGQTITQPYTVGLLAQLARLSGSEKVLEIGTGSGYTAAVLAALAERVYTIERITALSNQARKVFNSLGYKNIVCLTGDGTVGVERYAPYDVIVVTAGAPEIPQPLARQLAEGGRMILPVRDGEGQRLMVVERAGERFKVTRKAQCLFVPLIGRHGWEERARAAGKPS